MLKLLGLRVGAIVATIVSIPLLTRAQGTPPVHPGVVVINFAVPVDTNSSNALLRVVSAQMQQGVTKITILISSPGGDTISAIAAYNILRNLPIDLTTINIGTVDSAALLIYCAGAHRKSLDGPGMRFLIHGNSASSPVALDANAMDAQLQQLKNMNQMVGQVLSGVAPKRKQEIEKAISSQTILTPQQAKDWGLVQEITDQIIPPGASFIAVNSGPELNKEPKFQIVSPEISVVSPTISAAR